MSMLTPSWTVVALVWAKGACVPYSDPQSYAGGRAVSSWQVLPSRTGLRGGREGPDKTRSTRAGQARKPWKSGGLGEGGGGREGEEGTLIQEGTPDTDRDPRYREGPLIQGGDPDTRLWPKTEVQDHIIYGPQPLHHAINASRRTRANERSRKIDI